MKTEMHINRTLELWLDPETDLEAAVLRQMADAAAKGEPVALTAGGHGAVLGVPIVPMERGK
jgi:hypothetical protein